MNEPGDPRPDDPVLPPRLLPAAAPVKVLTWRFRHDLPESLVAELERVLAAEPVTADIPNHRDASRALQATLVQHGLLTGTLEWTRLAFSRQSPNRRSLRPEHEVISAHAPRMTISDALLSPVLATGRRCPGDCLVWRTVDHPRARSGFPLLSARATLLLPLRPGLIRREEFRGRGYAPAVVAAWAQAVREQGRIPLYSTSWTTWPRDLSRRKLGLVLYGTDLSID